MSRSASSATYTPWDEWRAEDYLSEYYAEVMPDEQFALAFLHESLERLAEVYTGIFLNHSLPFRVARLERMLGEFSCHGFVMHSNRSCKPLSLGQPAARRRVAEATCLPGLLLEADMCDTRVYADQPIATRIVAFVESLAGRA